MSKIKESKPQKHISEVFEIIKKRKIKTDLDNNVKENDTKSSQTQCLVEVVED